MYIEAFTTHFGELSDTRQSAKVTYPLEDILFITLCGVVAGAEGWSEIRDYADGHILRLTVKRCEALISAVTAMNWSNGSGHFN